MESDPRDREWCRIGAHKSHTRRFSIGSAGVRGTHAQTRGETEVTQCIISRNSSLRRACCGLLCAVLLGIPQTASAQLPGQISGSAQGQADQCNGPLGALLPECQPKTSVDLPSTLRTRGLAASPSVIDIMGDENRPAAVVAPVAAQAFAPEPPSEFQRFVASSVGRILPIFGAALFDKVPTTFAPMDRVPVTADYVIGPGDEIILRVWGQLSLDLKLTVDRAGSIYIPQVGSVSISGIQFRQLPDYLRSQLERVFRNFDLSVNMGQLRSIQIFVMGQARRPGTYTVSSLSTLVNALFASGGPSAQGSMRRIQVKRGSQVAAEVDMYDLLLRGDKSADVRLLPEDVVYIPPVGPQVAATGSLKNPAIYELKTERTVGDLIQMTGGLSPMADRQRAILERIKGSSSREVLEVALGTDGLNTQVMDGDVLQVLTIAPRFENAVTLRGNVANPGRFRWHPGMRLLDIIPDRESLITRDYWKKRNLLGYTPPEESIAAEPAAEGKRKAAETRVEFVIPDINWSYAVIERQNPKDLKTELIPFHLGKLVQENDQSQNLELRAGDVVTIFSQGDIRVPQMQQTRTVRLEGEFNAPGVYTVGPGETLGQLIQKAGGLTPQAYLFGAEYQRESTRRDQQARLEQYAQDLESEVETAGRNRLANAAGTEDSAKLAAEIQSQQQIVRRLRQVQAKGRIVLSLQPGSNDISGISRLAVEDGDRFVVPAQPATINVFGAVYNPNSLIHTSNRSVTEYIRQTGGFTRSADEGRIYVIRADGSVLPKANTPGFEKSLLYPGDSVVVPERIFKTSILTGLRNWSQVIANFGLGIAAINVLQ
jgi:polysaccharide biosynthesis/export protein